MIGRSLILPSWILLKSCSSERREEEAIAFSRSFCWRKVTIERARVSSSTTWNASPACGRSSKPVTSTGVAGPASSSRVAAVVLHRADAAEDRAREEDVADVQRARLDQDGRDVAAAGLAARLEHDAPRVRRRRAPRAPACPRRGGSARAGGRCPASWWPRSRPTARRRPTTRAARCGPRAPS